MRELKKWLKGQKQGTREAQLARMATAADLTTFTLRRYAKGQTEPKPRVRAIILDFINNENPEG